jgi:hypothetical protein
VDSLAFSLDDSVSAKLAASIADQLGEFDMLSDPTHERQD